MTDNETPLQGPAGPVSPLRRSRQSRMFAGVAGGIAEHFGLDVTLVRVVVGALAIAGIGVPLYIAGWLLLPEEGQDHSLADEVLEDLFGHRAHA